MLRVAGRCYVVALILGGAYLAGWAAARSVAMAATVLVVLVPLWVAVIVIVVLRWWRPPTTAFLWRARRAREPGAEPVVMQWVPGTAISPELQLAAIAGEDVYFSYHSGFDWQSLRAAREHNRATGARRRGGSTITQQLVKNLFLWPGRSYVRKALEAYLTVIVESLWPKQRILEVYLNVVQFGPATFGAEAAAQRFFGKPARDLTRSEAALLVAVLPNPTERRVDDPDRLVRYRQLLIVGSMKKLEHHQMAKFWGTEVATS